MGTTVRKIQEQVAAMSSHRIPWWCYQLTFEGKALSSYVTVSEIADYHKVQDAKQMQWSLAVQSEQDFVRPLTTKDLIEACGVAVGRCRGRFTARTILDPFNRTSRHVYVCQDKDPSGCIRVEFDERCETQLHHEWCWDRLVPGNLMTIADPRLISSTHLRIYIEDLNSVKVSEQSLI